MIADLSTDMEERIHSLEKLLALTPNDTRSREMVNRLRHLKENPNELAAIYEEQGELDKAIEQYQRILMHPQFKKQRRQIDRKIIQLKVRRGEKIVHISPAASIARLAAGPPLVYFSMLLIHVGIDPFAAPDLVLWMELLVTLFGGLLVAFASVLSKSFIYKEISSIFQEHHSLKEAISEFSVNTKEASTAIIK